MSTAISAGPTTDPAQLLDVRQVAQRLAVSTATVRRWADTGVIPPGHKIGGCRRWTARELADWQAGLSSGSTQGEGGVNL